MKKIISLVLAALLFSAAPVFAEMDGLSADFSLGVGSEPEDGFGTGAGFRFGISAGVDRLFNVNSSFAKKLQLRADWSYFHWEDTVGGFGILADLEYTRIPVFLGARYFFLDDIIKVPGFGLYGEGGLEISVDEAETITPVGLVSDDDVRFGIPVGGGVQYIVADKIVLGFNLRYHLISDSYLGAMFSVGYKIW